MANRNFASSRMFGYHLMPVRLGTSISFGASGAPTLNSTSTGFSSVTKLSTGVYQVQLADNYPSVLRTSASMISAPNGTSVTAGAFTTGTLYQITALGTTNWAAIGLPAGATPAIGQAFVATGAGSGTGTAQAVIPSGISSVELAGAAIAQINPYVQGQGAILIITTLAPTSSSTTTIIPTSPASGSTMQLQVWANNSSVQ